MEEFAPMEMSPRRKSATEWAKEKVKEADFVAVGVNVVVGALLVGGLVGALFLPDSGARDPAVNAAIVTHDDALDNSTEPTGNDGSIAVADDDDEEDDEHQKPK